MVSEEVHTVQPAEVDPPVDHLVGIKGSVVQHRSRQPNPKFL